LRILKLICRHCYNYNSRNPVYSVFGWTADMNIVFTNHFSVPGRAVGPLFVCVCIWTRTFVQNDLWPRYLACWFTLTLSTSCSKIKVYNFVYVY